MKWFTKAVSVWTLLTSVWDAGLYDAMKYAAKQTETKIDDQVVDALADLFGGDEKAK